MGHFRKNMISVFVNDFCNMRCIYCKLHSGSALFSVNDQPNVIDLDFAKCGIKDFFQGTGSFQLRIFSNGEATLSFGRTCEIKDYAYSMAGDKLFVELQTNAFFNEDVAEWVGENVDMLWVSLDGLNDVQNKNRPTGSGESSFPTIDRNIQYIKKYGKSIIGLRPTITCFNVDKQIELIDYAKENDLAAIYAYPWVSFLSKIEGQPDLMYFADKFLEAREYAEKIGVFYSNIFIINFDEEVEINCRALLPAPHLTTDGFVSCCDMMNSGNGLLQELIYGKYNPETKKIQYFPARIEKIKKRNIYNLKECEDCEVLKHCAGGCIGSSMVTSGDFFGINPEYCEVTKYLFKQLSHTVNIGYNPGIPLHP